MAIEGKTFNSPQESNIKHTSAGEMPDPSKISNISNRLRVNASVFAQKEKSKYIIWSLTGLGIGFGIYFLVRSFQKFDLEAE
jgi:hypothetical protein